MGRIWFRRRAVPFSPSGIAIDSNGAVYVADRDNARIQVFDAQGNFLRKWGEFGSGDGQFGFPSDIAIDSSGRVYVADTGNHRIQVFDAAGNFLRQWGEEGSGDGQFFFPLGIAIDSSGAVYVADADNRVQVFNPQGNFLGKWEGSGFRDGEFRNPEGVALDSNGAVYVVDTDNHRVQVFRVSFELLAIEQGTLNVVVSPLTGGIVTSSPTGINCGRGNGDCSETVDIGMSLNLTANPASGYEFAGWIGACSGTGTCSVTVDSALEDVTANFIEQGTLNVVVSPLTGGVVTSSPTGINCGNGNTDCSETVNQGTSITLTANPTPGYRFTGWSGACSGMGTCSVTVDSTRESVTALFEVIFFNIRNIIENVEFVRTIGGKPDAPGQFKGPEGIAIDSSGAVYVADSGNDRIQVFDARGNFIRQWGGFGFGDGQFKGPEGIAIDSSGAVYVADSGNDRIQVFDAQGNFIRKWGEFGSGDGQFGFPQGIAIDSSGAVYVVDFGNRRIQVFDAQGNFIRQWGEFGFGDGQFNRPFGIALDASGVVYVADSDNDRVQVFGARGNFIRKWGESGSGDGQFDQPNGIAIDASGAVYVTDTRNGRIQVFDVQGNFIRQWGERGSGDGQFGRPRGIAIDASGAVYVADSSNDRIQAFDAQGNFIRQWGEEGSEDGRFIEPVAIALDVSGAVYVTDVDYNRNRIQVFDVQGNFIRQWGERGSGDGQFNIPTGIAIDASGAVYVADVRIQVFDAQGNFIRKWGESGSGDGQFNRPSGIAIDASGAVYVVDSRNHRIQVFDAQGNFLRTWGWEGSGDGQFDDPNGIAIDASGAVYVADGRNDRIQVFDAQGKFIRKWGEEGSGDGQFDRPNGIAIDASGAVYVTDYGNSRIQVFDAQGKFIGKWGERGGSIAIDSSGVVYVVDYSNSRVLVFRVSFVPLPIGQGILNVVVSPTVGGSVTSLQGGINCGDGNTDCSATVGLGTLVTLTTNPSSGYEFVGWSGACSGTGTCSVTVDSIRKDVTAKFAVVQPLNFVRTIGGPTDAPGQFGLPSNVALSTDGNVYVADAGNDRIQVFNAQGNFIRQWGEFGSGDGQFSFPQGIAIDSSGAVYVADSGNDRIQVFDARGNFLSQWYGQFNRPSGIAIDSSGAVYVVDSFDRRPQVFISSRGGAVHVSDTFNSRVQVFDTQGNFIQQWGEFGSRDGRFGGSYGIALDASGAVYVTNILSGRVQVFDAQGNSLREWGEFGSGDGQFRTPIDIALDASGRVYVADTNNNRIQVFDVQGNFIRQWGEFGSGDGQFSFPSGIAIDASGTVYVTDRGNDRIQVFDVQGNFLRKWGTPSGDGQFRGLSRIALDASDTVYVTDSNNDRIQVFDADGNFLRKWGKRGSVDGQFNFPRGIAIDSSGAVYVTDSNNDRIQVFDADGNFLRKWGKRGSVDGQFNFPRGIAIDSSGAVYVTDASNNRIQVFDAQGNFIRKWGEEGSGDGQFSFPQGIAIDSSGAVYVADSLNDRVQVFNAQGNFLGKWGEEGSGGGQFDRPNGIAIGSSGAVHVADSSNNRIQVFNARGNFLGKWGERGSGDGQFRTPSGIALDSSGAVYVTDSGNDRIQVFRVSFAPLPIEQGTLNVVVSPLTGGVVTSSPTSINCGDGNTDCSSAVDFETVLTLTAAAAPGYTFGNWSGACSGTGTCSVTIGSTSTNVTANFEREQGTLNVVVSPLTGGVVTSSPTGINCGNGNDDCAETVNIGTSITLTANPASGYEFAGWRGACSGTGTCSVTVDSALEDVTANFTFVRPAPIEQGTLNVVVSPTAGGIVTSSPAGINCGDGNADCSETVNQGTSITLTANPASGYEFAGWSGACSGTGTCSVTVSSALADVTANFAVVQPAPIEQGALNIVVSPLTGGVVTSKPAGIDCGNGRDACTVVGLETAAVLTAIPEVGYVFEGWSGACSGVGTCRVTVGSAAIDVIANFEREEGTLNVVVSPFENGAVTSSPAGINCGGGNNDCSDRVALGTRITLTAEVYPGNVFGGWDGACSGTGTCRVTVDSATVAVEASFRPATLNVVVSPVAGGVVTSELAGIDCGNGRDACTVVGLETDAVLTATPAAGYVFEGWGGECFGILRCTVPYTGIDAAVSATFSEIATLFVYVTPEPGGLITAPGIRCGMGETLCEAEVAVGEDIEVQVETTAAEYIFSGWTGACTGDGSCVITIDEAEKFVTASFEATFDKTLRELSEADRRIGGLRADPTQTGAVQVYLTDYEEATEADKARILEAINEEYDAEFDTLTLTSATYTLMQLEEWYDLIYPEVWALTTTVLSDLDEGENRILIGVSTQAAITQTLQLTESLGVPPEAVEVVETFITAQAQSIRANDEPLNPIVGGASITLCTLGFGVHAEALSVQYGRNTSGFITNSHCTHTQGGVEDTNFYHGGSRIGVEIADPDWKYSNCEALISFRRCRRSDSALAQYTSDTTLEVGLIAKPRNVNSEIISLDVINVPDLHQIASSDKEGYFQISGIESSLSIGKTVHKVGRTTGWTQARIDQLNSNVLGTLGSYSTDKGYSKGGDSGSPVFISARGNRVELVGIHFAGGSSGSSFSPIDSIFDELFPDVPVQIRRVQRGNPLVSYEVEWLGDDVNSIKRELKFTGETDKFLFRNNGRHFISESEGAHRVRATRYGWRRCITPSEEDEEWFDENDYVCIEVVGLNESHVGGYTLRVVEGEVSRPAPSQRLRFIAGISGPDVGYNNPDTSPVGNGYRFGSSNDPSFTFNSEKVVIDALFASTAGGWGFQFSVEPDIENELVDSGYSLAISSETNNGQPVHVNLTDMVMRGDYLLLRRRTHLSKNEEIDRVILEGKPFSLELIR